MRRDARKLLEKLNRKDFAYKVFEDPFSETELWPIFEAVLGDHGIVGEDAVPTAPRDTAPLAKAASPRLSVEPSTSPNQIFAQYGHAGRKRPEAGDADLGAFFHRFSGMD